MTTQCSPYLSTDCVACAAACTCPAGPGTDTACRLHGEHATHAAAETPEHEALDGAALTR